MEQYTIYCSQEQTKRAYYLGAPLSPLYTTYVSGEFRECLTEKDNAEIDNIHAISIPLPKSDIRHSTMCRAYEIPTVEQMCGWLREKGVNCYVSCIEDDYGGWFDIPAYNKYDNTNCYESYTPAILDTIDAALDYLEKKGE